MHKHQNGQVILIHYQMHFRDTVFVTESSSVLEWVHFQSFKLKTWQFREQGERKLTQCQNLILFKYENFQKQSPLSE